MIVDICTKHDWIIQSKLATHEEGLLQTIIVSVPGSFTGHCHSTRMKKMLFNSLQHHVNQYMGSRHWCWGWIKANWIFSRIFYWHSSPNGLSKYPITINLVILSLPYMLFEYLSICLFPTVQLLQFQFLPNQSILSLHVMCNLLFFLPSLTH